jgi:hypothetical protein
VAVAAAAVVAAVAALAATDVDAVFGDDEGLISPPIGDPPVIGAAEVETHEWRSLIGIYS